MSGSSRNRIKRFARQLGTALIDTVKQPWKRVSHFGLIGLLCAGTIVGVTTLAHAQDTVQQQEERLIREFALPKPAERAPVFRQRPAQPNPAPNRQNRPTTTRSEPSRPANRPPADRPPSRSAGRPAQPPSERQTPVVEQLPRPAVAATSEYILEFNRSPVVGNRFRLQGTVAEARLGFTRPRSWKIQSAKAVIRFQHSPALLENRSNLTVLVNNTSVGSVPLNRRASEIGQVMFNIPPRLLQDSNEITMVAQQGNSTDCSHPGDTTLWTEILPDSKLVFEFTPEPVTLDFARYPFPFLDTLALDTARLAYLRPKTVTENWLTTAARLQASLGRQAQFRPIETRLVGSIDQVHADERLIVIGTAAEQPILGDLSLPFALRNRQWVDAKQEVLPGDVGVLMMATTEDNRTPILIATGNDAVGVAKSVQFLVQPGDRKLGTGQAMLVNSVGDVPSPDPRNWPQALPLQDTFQLSDLSNGSQKLDKDITVKGSYPPPIRIDFRALPDDRFRRGSSMTLDFSYGPQANPRTSAVEVRLDGIAVGGKQLTNVRGGRDSLTVALPENLIRTNSVLNVQFVMLPRDLDSCGTVPNQQLWATVHPTTRFNLKRDNAVELPDLRLLQTGFPLAAPQDLSNLAIALPNAPTGGDITTLLKFSERLGRTTRSESVKLDVFLAESLPMDVRDERHLVGIGTRDRFPLPEVFEKSGFNLGAGFLRQQGQSQVQTMPDVEGMVKSVISPWNGDRILLALTAQTETGLTSVQDVFKRDPLFFQLQGDTVLVGRNPDIASPHDPNAYSLDFFQESTPQLIDRSGLLSRASYFLQHNWLFLPTGIVMASLVLYGATQFYLNGLGR